MELLSAGPGRGGWWMEGAAKEDGCWILDAGLEPTAKEAVRLVSAFMVILWFLAPA